MKMNTFVDNKNVVCSVICWLEDQRQILFYSKIGALGRH